MAKKWWKEIAKEGEVKKNNNSVRNSEILNLFLSIICIVLFALVLAIALTYNII